MSPTIYIPSGLAKLLIPLTSSTRLVPCKLSFRPLRLPISRRA
jgi:hypothetical protein